MKANIESVSQMKFFAVTGQENGPISTVHPKELNASIMDLSIPSFIQRPNNVLQSDGYGKSHSWQNNPPQQQPRRVTPVIIG